MTERHFLIYLLVTAGVTYLVRMLPLVLMRKKITNRFILSFLHYIPYSVLAVMTVPAIFYATDHPVPAIAGFITAVFLAYKGKSLVQVAAAACVMVLLISLMF